MNKETVYLGAGCFWGVENILKKLDGILHTEVGYMGGHTKDPNYKEVCSGETMHAEIVKVDFNPEKISFEKILNYFWRLHDPTTLNRQHNDIGTQYRSIIFYTSENQKKLAIKSKKEFDANNSFGTEAVTCIEVAKDYYKAEDYHQDYLLNNPNGYNCHILRNNY